MFVDAARLRSDLEAGRAGQALAALRRMPLAGRAGEIDAVGRVLGEYAHAVPPNAEQSVSMALLGSFTTDPIANAARCVMAREGFWPRVYEAPLQAFRQEILDSASGLYRERPDFVLLALHAEAVAPFPAPGTSPAQVQADRARVVEEFVGYWNHLHDRLSAQILQHTLPFSPWQLAGEGERAAPCSTHGYVEDLNRALREAAPPFVHWVDTHLLANCVGIEQWRNRRLHFVGKYGFDPRFLDRYALCLAGVLRALWGRAKKCIVLDLDNTLWGGVVGDDGLDGIELGNGSPTGEAYADFCAYLKQLKERGILLAVCSKNEETAAREVFERHRGMPLAWTDFAAVRCNWQDKPANLADLARELNLGLAHLLFVDDNPAECELVAGTLPEIDVVQLTGDPAGFPAQLDRAHWFDLTTLSAEDVGRSRSYAARRSAEELQRGATDLGAYLTALDMRGEIGEATAADLPRLAQMEAKTNQFNLTTRRFTADELEGMSRDERHLVLACRLADRFADHGLVASMVVRRDGDRWVIQNWLMSCRVFSRTLEHFMFRALWERAAAAQVREIVGLFRPSERNGVVRDLYRSLGFDLAATRDEGEEWHCAVAPDRVPPATYVRRADV